MLSKRNVGWASTCNSVGQTIGYFFGYLGFLALDSPMFCNLFRGEDLETGCVTMQVQSDPDLTAPDLAAPRLHWVA